MLPRYLLLAFACLVLTACGVASASPGGPVYVRKAAAMALINDGVVALEQGWYADHGTYAGATAARLRAKYDAGTSPRLIVKS
jgi:hypothetical protein